MASSFSISLPPPLSLSLCVCFSSPVSSFFLLSISLMFITNGKKRRLFCFHSFGSQLSCEKLSCTFICNLSTFLLLWVQTSKLFEQWISKRKLIDSSFVRSFQHSDYLSEHYEYRIITFNNKSNRFESDRMGSNRIGIDWRTTMQINTLVHKNVVNLMFEC